MPSSADRPRLRNRTAVPWITPAMLLVVAFIVVPIVNLAARTITSESVIGVWRHPGVMDAIRFTLVETVLSTILTVALGLAPAWAFSRWQFRGRRFMLSTVTLPFVLPTVVVGASFLELLPTGSNRGLLAVLLAHVYFNLSVIIRTVGPIWATIDPMLTSAAHTLGASPTRSFLTVTIPLLRPGLMAATGIVGFMCATSYGIVRILGGDNTTIEVEIYRRAMSFGDLSGAATLALAQLLVVTGCLAAWRRRERAVTNELAHRGVPRRTPRLAPMVAAVSTTIIAIPLISLVISSVRNRGRWTLAGWRIITDRRSIPGLNIDLVPVIIRSMSYAIVATAIAIPVGVLATRLRASRSDHARSAERLLLLPLGASAVAVGLGIVVTYNDEFIDLRGTWFILPLVHAVVALPFVIRTIAAVQGAIPLHLRSAAMTLGAPPFRTWRTIEWPLLLPAVRTTAAMSMAISLGEFGATSLLTRRDTDTLPIAVDRLLGRSGDLARLAGLSTAVVLLALTATVFLTLGRSDHGVIR